MDTQNQNDVQPDYGFILNQGKDTAGSSQHAPQKNHKPKLLLIAGGIFIFFLLVIAIIAATIGSNVKQGTVSQDSKDVIEQYFVELEAKNYAPAYELLATSTRPPSAEVFAKEPPALAAFVKLETCIAESGETANDVDTVSLSCQRESQETQVNLTAVTLKDSNTTKIAQVSIEVDDE